MASAIEEKEGESSAFPSLRARAHACDSPLLFSFTAPDTQAPLVVSLALLRLRELRDYSQSHFIKVSNQEYSRISSFPARINENARECKHLAQSSLVEDNY